MMSRHSKLQDTFERWQRYEAAGDERRAERALARFLTALPPTEVPAGFATRVLSAAGLEFAAARPASQAPGWIWRTAFGVWLVSSFLVAVGASGFAVDLARSGQVLDLGTRLVVALSRIGADLLTVAAGLLRAATAISVAFSGPGVLALVLACSLASLAALGALKPLLSPERSRHAESY